MTALHKLADCKKRFALTRALRLAEMSHACADELVLDFICATNVVSCARSLLS